MQITLTCQVIKQQHEQGRYQVPGLALKYTFWQYFQHMSTWWVEMQSIWTDNLVNTKMQSRNVYLTIKLRCGDRHDNALTYGVISSLCVLYPWQWTDNIDFWNHSWLLVFLHFTLAAQFTTCKVLWLPKQDGITKWKWLDPYLLCV